MKKAWILVFALILTFFAVHSSADGVMAALNQKIATRTGNLFLFGLEDHPGPGPFQGSDRQHLVGAD